MATKPQVNIRVGMEGRAQIKNDLAEIRRDGEAAFDAVGKSAKKATNEAIGARQQMTSPLPPLPTASPYGPAYTPGKPTAENFVGPLNRASFGVLEREAQALKAVLDPVAAAQDRLTEATRRYDRLLAYNKLTIEQHRKLVDQVRQAYEQLDREQTNGKGLGLTSHQLRMMATSTLPDLAQGLLAGQLSFASFVNQAGQAVQIASMGPGGLGGALSGITKSIPPVVGAVALLSTTAIAGTAAILSYQKAQDQLALALMGVGRASGLTVAALDAQAIRVSRAAEISVSAAREQQAAYLRLGITAPEILERIGRITKDYALVTGGDAKSAVAELGAAFADPARGAETLGVKLGALDAKTVEHIQTLQRQEGRLAAQKALIDALQPTLDGARDHVSGLSKAYEGLATAVSNANNAFLAQFALPFATQEEKDKRLIADFEARQKKFGAVFAPFSGYDSAKARQKQRDDTAAKDAEDAQGKILGNEAKARLERLNPIAVQRKALNDDLVALKKDRDADRISEKAYIEAKAAANRTLASLDKRENPSDRRAESLRRDSEAMEVNAQKALELADAYLKSDSAAMKAEADRKAYTDATRKGTDEAARAQRQLDLDIAETAANGAKAVADARGRAEAQSAINARVRDGTLAARDMAEALQTEAALRQLVTAQTLDEGKAKEKLTKVIEQLKAQTEADIQAQKDANLLRSTEQNRDEIEFLNLKLSLIGKTASQTALAISRYQSLKEIEAQGHPSSKDSPEAAAYVDSERALTIAQLNYDKAKAYHDDIQDMAENSFDRFGDLLLKGETQWKSYADAGKAALRDLAAEMLKLSVINPAKNFLFGQNNPTASDGSGVLSTIFNMFSGGSKAKAGGSFAPTGPVDIAAIMKGLPSVSGLGSLANLGSVFKIPHFAMGTSSAPGGWSVYGENGPELGYVPRGTRLFPAGETRRMLGLGGGPMVVNNYHQYDLSGSYPARELFEHAHKTAAVAGATAAKAAVKASDGRALNNVQQTTKDRG